MDHDTRRQKQQALITELIERKIRLHAQQLYDKRGKAEGFALQDWIEAESQVFEKASWRRSTARRGRIAAFQTKSKRSPAHIPLQILQARRPAPSRAPKGSPITS